MRRGFREAIWIIGISVALGSATALLHPRAPSWFLVEESGRWDISAREFREILGADIDRVAWVDSRTDDEFQEAHLEGAIRLNRERWGELVAANRGWLDGAAGRPVIVYGNPRERRRSLEIAERLRQLLGLEPVYVLSGDWRDLR